MSSLSEKVGLREALTAYYRDIMVEIERFLRNFLKNYNVTAITPQIYDMFIQDYKEKREDEEEKISRIYVPLLYFLLYEVEAEKETMSLISHILNNYDLKNVDIFFITGLLSPKFSETNEEKLELIEQANEMISTLHQGEIPTSVLVYYLLVRGNVLWELSAFSSAALAFQTAIDTMLATNTIVESASDACFKVGQYYNLIGDLPSASKYFELGLNFARAEQLTEKMETLRELAFQCYVGSASTMAHAARAHAWAHEHKQGAEFIIKGAYYIAKAGSLDVTKLKNQQITDLLILLIEISRYLRSEKLHENKITELLNSLLSETNIERLQAIVLQLITVTKRLNKPEPYYLLLVHETGAPIFSYAFQQGDIPVHMGNSVEDPSDKDLLYSSLLSAISTAMSSASGNKEEIKVIDQGDVVIIIERGVHLTAYLFANRNAFELREALAGFIAKFEHLNKNTLENFRGDLSSMDSKGPLLTHFKEYLLDSF